MLLRDRSDGKRVTGLANYNAVMPYIMRRRNESAVLFGKDIDVENALRYVRARNADNPETNYSLFGLFLAAAVRTVALKPRLNRFIHGKGVYQRSNISFSFIVKKRLTEEAEEVCPKVRFEPTDTIDLVMKKFNEAVERARSEDESTKVPSGAIDRTIKALQGIPGGKALFSVLFRLLDRFNLAPAGLLEDDPLFTSVYFANLGSIGLETPYHHLYEWGTASIFVVLGRMFQKEAPRSGGSPTLRHFITFKATVDERIADGIYFAHAIALFVRLVTKPELLESPPDLQTVEG